jgi:hypothetical protein
MYIAIYGERYYRPTGSSIEEARSRAASKFHADPSDIVILINPSKDTIKFLQRELIYY